MTFRTAYGNTVSENGWRMVNRDACGIVAIPDLYLVDTAPLRAGAPLTILGAWLRWYDQHVEEITTPVWGWSAENLVKNSNHLSGTAVDVCAPKYPWGQRTMPAAKIRKVREGLKLFGGSVFWGADWSRADEMHYQMAWPEGDSRNDAFAQKLRGGYLGIYKTAPTPPARGLTAQVLADAMGNAMPLARYEALLPEFVRAMRAADITTVTRAAHWMSQLGHESLGLSALTEFADGSAYEGRRDLGNTLPGDGTRFRGRGAIMVTGRGNYTALSRWAYGRGIVPTGMYFVDNPTALASDKYFAVGAQWYWTQARPMNNIADTDDVVAVTKAINGGTNGLDDRRRRLARCKALGAALLPAENITEEGVFMSLTDAEQHELLKKTREIHDQMGINIWGPDSSVGLTDDGRELTLRDGLARGLRLLDAVARKVGL